ncbi:hypothetical protein EA187_12690 [Lujinxingia sediminis]|uniref:phospholipase D n=1 Tax=Lujinxingia sediminis TaxID=2480984 RepID=A0ABY0CT16_9DELT|nr:hypothetical protein [Lujinxingia sediminis]RVU43676.1 hypothetical protein EA187_12690 [Lujinxingia sediminis]
MRRTIPYLTPLALAGVLALAAPTTTTDWVEPARAQSDDYEGWFTYVDYYVGDDVQADVIAGMVRDIDRASEQVEAAFGMLEEPAIVDALEAAAARGVAVRVVSDSESSSVSGIQALLGNPDIDTVLGDGPISYLPDPTLTTVLGYCDDHSSGDYIVCTAASGVPSNNDNMVNRPDAYNVMSHSFVVVDTTTVWNVSAPINDAQPMWLAFRAMSEDLARSFRREFNQMHGGVFSTTLSVYNGPLKSITQNVTLRQTNRGQMRVTFNPQERLVKNIIDEVYRAKGSVWLMTNDLQNGDLINALRYKRDAGFDVRVLVGSTQGTSVDADLDAIGAVRAPASMGQLPTFIINDAGRGRDGRNHPRLVQMLSHNLWEGAPLNVISRVPNDRVHIYKSDTFVDGAMWEIVEFGSDRYDAVESFVDAWQQLWSEAQ